VRFEAEALLIELECSNRRLIELLQEQHKLLREILKRLPPPKHYHPTVGGEITVRS